MAHTKGSVSKGDVISEWKAGGSPMARPAATSVLGSDAGKSQAMAGQSLSQLPVGLVGPVAARPGPGGNVASDGVGGFPKAGGGPGTGLVSGSGIDLIQRLRRETQGLAAPRGDHSAGWLGESQKGK